MATSLAEQLKNLAVPQTNLFKDDKKRVSLLFDPRDAASLRKETVYDIGLEGLAELISKNRCFEQFNNNLFHVSSKAFERTVQTKESNRKVDKTINQFLLLLSPYFLTNAAHKSLEWLFYRFIINEYNKKELLMLSLPYHNSNIFVKLIQTLKFKDETDPFYFLKPLQKPGLHLPKQNLLNHASSNINFIKHVSKYITQLINLENPNILTAQFNFYCTVFLGAIQFSTEINEDLVSQILPAILKGLNSDIPDFAAASYVITAKLLVRKQFSDKLLNILLEKISDVKCGSLKLESILVLLVIYQSQKQYLDLPPVALSNLCEKEWLPSCLQYLNTNGNNIYPFLKVLLVKAVEDGLNNNHQSSRVIITKILDEIKLDDSFVELFIWILIEAYDFEIEYSSEANQWLGDLVNKLEIQYPSSFDQIIIKISTDKNLSSQKRAGFQKILGNILKYKENFEFLSHLFDTKQEINEETLTSVSYKFKSLKSGEQELFKNYVFNRLFHDNPKEVEKTLKLLVYLDITIDSLLEGILLGLISKDKLLSEKWDDVIVQTTFFLCKNKKFSWSILISIIPFIVLYSKKYLKYVKKLFKFNFFSDNNLFSKFSKNATPLHDHKYLVKSFLACFDNNIDVKIIHDILKSVGEMGVLDCLNHFSTVLLLSHALPDQCCPDVSVSVIKFIETFDGTKQLSRKTALLNEYLEICLKNEYPIVGIENCVKTIISKTLKPKSNWELIDFSKNSNDSHFLRAIFSLAFDKRNFKNALETFFYDMSCDLNGKVTVYLNICAFGEVMDNCIINALTYLKKFLMGYEGNDSEYIKTSTCLYLLVLLCNENADIRKHVLDLIDVLLKSSLIRSEDYIYFFEHVLKHREEIFIDNEQTPLIIHNLLTPTNVKRKSRVIKSDLIVTDLLQVCCYRLTPVYVKSGILSVLAHVNSFEITEYLSENLSELYEESDFENKHHANIYLNLISRIEPRIVVEVTSESSSWKFIKYCLKTRRQFIINNQKTSLPVLMLNQLTRDVYAILPEVLLEELLDLLCEICVTQDEPEVLTLSSKIYKHLDLNANLIVKLLETMRDLQMNKTETMKKRRRASVAPTVDILDTLEWKKGISILEFLQDKKKIRNGECLLPLLFDILKRCLDFEEQAAVEYTKQLILSLILSVCSKVEKESIPKNLFNVELVIQCIRASQNPQTHHHALMVLANVAELIPSEVLHHIMAVFTFMGSSLIRHDDAYSFQIISKIIDSIIPILVSGGIMKDIVNVLRVFVDALLDVPEHRRIPMYKQLIDKIGAKEHLYLFLLLIFESQVLHSAQEKQKTDKGGHLSKRLKIAHELCFEFHTKITLSSCILLVKYLKKLPDEKEDVMEADNIIMCNINYSPKQFRHYKYLIVTFITNLLSSQKYVNAIAELTEDENLSTEDLYKEFIVTVLTFLQRLQKVAEKASNSPQAHYWKTLLFHTYDILDSVNALLTPQMFLLVVKGLLRHNIHTVKRRALEILNSRLQQNSQYFEVCNESELYALIPSLVNIIELVKTEQLVLQEHEVLVQTALLSLKLLVKAMGSEEPEKILKILEFVTNILNTTKMQNNVLASVILCLVELCTHLRAHAISCLADFMPAFLKILKNQKHEDVSNLLLLSVVTAVSKLFDSLSLFLSPYMKKIVYEISILLGKWGDVSNDSKSMTIINKLTNIKQKIGSRISARILIPTIDECYDELVEKRHLKAISALMDTLAEHINNLSMKEINAFMQPLSNLFLKALQFRSNTNSTLDESNLIEGHIVKALTVLVLKLSESSFRPLFLKLYDWAVRSEDQKSRLITFYNLLQTLAQSLKGLFVLFASHFLNHASQVITKINISFEQEQKYFEDDIKNVLLLEMVLRTLQAVFTYDSQKFINKNRFDLLMQPLIDQLENTLGGIKGLVERNKNLLTPTIVHFFIAVGDDSLWKQMNYQILLKMRNPTPEIRLVALHCLTEVVSKLGEEFLPLLPETIPFLAELLEDEEEKVEKACQKAIHEMEKVLGEPLQKYF